MRHASREFKKAAANQYAYYLEADIAFEDGREKPLGKDDFYISGNGYTDGAGMSSFAIGEAISKTLRLVLVNDDDRFSDYDFYMAKITAYCCADLDGGKERVLLGEFFVTSPEAYGAQLEVNAVDGMYKADKEYSTSMQFPASILDILTDSCGALGVELATTDFPNKDFMVQSKPEQLTYRQVWGMCAMIAGGNARMDEHNRLEIKHYDRTLMEMKGLDGGKFDGGTPSYQTGDIVDGGDFFDYSSGYEFDGGSFKELENIHYFFAHKTPTVDTDDVVIDGLKLTANGNSYFYGENGYILSLENQLLAGKEQEGLELIGDLIIGMKFRAFEFEGLPCPAAEFGDACYVADRKANYYASLITDIDYGFYGYTAIKCSAESPLKNNSRYNSSVINAIAEAKKDTDGKIEDIYENIGNLEISLRTTEEGIEAEVKRAISAEEELSSNLTIAEGRITAEVSRAKGEEENLSSMLELAEGRITAEVSRATSAEGSLSSRLEITENGLLSKVDKNGIISQINQSAESVDIDASKINLNGYTSINDFFSVGTDGRVSIKDGDITLITQGDSRKLTLRDGQYEVGMSARRIIVTEQGVDPNNTNYYTSLSYNTVRTYTVDATVMQEGGRNIRDLFQAKGDYITSSYLSSELQQTRQWVLNQGYLKSIGTYFGSVSTSTSTYGTQATKYAVRDFSVSASFSGGAATLIGELALNYEGASDIRLKDHITDMPDLSQAYMALRLIRYKFKDDLTGHTKYWHYGISAQQLEDELAKLGITEDETGVFYTDEPDPYSNESDFVGDDRVKMIRKDELHYMHMQMIQMQQRQIDTMNDFIAQMRDRIEALEDEIKHLKSRA